MLLISHLIIALSSLVAATAAVIYPSYSKLKLSYLLTAATIATGTALVIVTHSPLLSSCLAGLTYTAVALSLIVAAQKRLAKDYINND
jgi:hypothetical protein